MTDDSELLSALNNIPPVDTWVSNNQAHFSKGYVEPQETSCFASRNHVLLYKSSNSLSSCEQRDTSMDLIHTDPLSTPIPAPPWEELRFPSINRRVTITELPMETKEQSTQRLDQSERNLLAVANDRENITLLPTSILSDRLRSLFPFEYFNSMQSKSFQSIYESDNNIVLSAPTGSGKTICFEFAIAKLLRTEQRPASYKIIYIGPTKSLCQERAKDWSQKFAEFNMRCKYPCDTEGENSTVLRDNDIIITTPEKWDAVTRKAKDHSRLVDLIRLLLVDEVHLLSDDRGPVLEVVISRMKLLSGLRIVAVSASLPNTHDVARWIGHVSSNEGMATSLTFGEEFRPVQLETYCYGYPQLDGENDFQFEDKLNGFLMQIIQRHSNSKPTLVFCSTRKGAQQTAQSITKQYDALRKASGSLPWIDSSETLDPFHNNTLKNMVQKRIGYHHAGLEMCDRALIEKLFLAGKLLVLCCTTTLAVGVNLPAHLVIIKNTQVYLNGQMSELEGQEILQMIGRAGRPQFGSAGVAVILTRSDKQMKYENIISGKRPLESRLHLQLVEHLNAEIGLGTVFNTESAKNWLQSTFWYVRCRANPSYYGVNSQADGVDRMVEEKCRQSIEILRCQGLVELVNERLRVTPYGEAAARYYLRLQTIHHILDLKEQATLKDVFETLCRAEEFSSLRIRNGERGFYNVVVNQNPLIRYPFKRSAKSQPVGETWQKVSLLIQIELGLVDLAEHEKDQKHMNHFMSAIQDKTYIFHHASRIAKCMRECLIYRKDAGSVLSVLTLERCLRARSWHDSCTILRQLRGIGLSFVRQLAIKGVKTFEDLRKVEPEELEMWLNRSTPFGRELLRDLERIPNYRLQVFYERKAAVQSQNAIRITIRAILGLRNIKSQEIGRETNKHVFATFLAAIDGCILGYQRFPHSSVGTQKEFKFDVIMTNPTQVIHCHVGCESIAGCEIDVICDPELDEDTFAGLLGQEVESIVRNQPTLSELVLKSMKTPKSAVYSPKTRGISSAPEIRFRPSIKVAPLPGTRKRKSEFGDGFSDIEIDDFDLDEDDIRQLDRIQSPERLPNGKYKCNHLCKDRKRCRHLCCKEGKVSKKTKFGVSTSKLKKISFQRSNQFSSETSGDKGQQNGPQASAMLKSSRSEARLESPLSYKVFSTGKPSYQGEESSDSVCNSALGDISDLIKVPGSGPRGVSVNMADGSHDKSERLCSSRTGGFKSHGAGIPREVSSCNEDEVIEDVSDDELPHPKDLLPKFRPSLGMANNITLSATSLTIIDSGINNGGNGGEFDSSMKTSKLNDVFTGFAFSIDDIFGCVEIV